MSSSLIQIDGKTISEIKDLEQIGLMPEQIQLLEKNRDCTVRLNSIYDKSKYTFPKIVHDIEKYFGFPIKINQQNPKSLIE